MIRRARKLGAEHGCDLVLVLKTGPYFGRQRSMRARIKEHGYAFVVFLLLIEWCSATKRPPFNAIGAS
jgi:hypothetical protein